MLCWVALEKKLRTKPNTSRLSLRKLGFRFPVGSTTDKDKCLASLEETWFPFAISLFDYRGEQDGQNIFRFSMRRKFSLSTQLIFSWGFLIRPTVQTFVRIPTSLALKNLRFSDLCFSSQIFLQYCRLLCYCLRSVPSSVFTTISSFKLFFRYTQYPCLYSL